MSYGPYSAYRGRRRHFRSILIGIAAALAVLLVGVLAGYYFGLFDIPGGTSSHAPASDTPTASADPTQDPLIIIEAPSAAPSPSIAPVEADLSACVIRDLPMGLVLADVDALPETSRHGVLVDMTDTALTELDADFSDKLAALPYAAAWMAPDWTAVGEDNFTETLTARCAALAALGFDEIVFSAADPAKGGDAALATVYAAVRDALDQAGWKGRLGLDLDQGWFDVDSAVIIPTIAGSFDRLYFRKTLSTGNKNTLTNGGFEANGFTIVTVIQSAADLNYAWAVLP